MIFFRKIIHKSIFGTILTVIYLNFMLNKIEGVRVKGIYSNPQHLIDYAENHHIDVVFMDVQMPGISGFDLADNY